MILIQKFNFFFICFWWKYDDEMVLDGALDKKNCLLDYIINKTIFFVWKISFFQGRKHVLVREVDFSLFAPAKNTTRNSVWWWSWLQKSVFDNVLDEKVTLFAIKKNQYF